MGEDQYGPPQYQREAVRKWLRRTAKGRQATKRQRSEAKQTPNSFRNVRDFRLGVARLVLDTRFDPSSGFLLSIMIADSSDFGLAKEGI